METININDVDFKEDSLRDYAKELILADIRVFMSVDNKNISYLKISKNGKIGYCQLESFTGFSFTTVHKPNRRSGTGYQTDTEIINPKIENALKTFINKPCWAVNDGVEIQKYKDIDDYMKNSYLKYIEVIL